MNQSESKFGVSPALSRAATALVMFGFGLAGSASAHHPDSENHRVIPYIDVIGPMGNRLPPSYRRKYNRPTHLGGKIMYWIAPSSQEAMAWHHASHAGAYKHPKKHVRFEQHYFYPKPWEAMKIGPRPSTVQSPESMESYPNGMIEELETETLQSVESGIPADPVPLPPSESVLELPDLNLKDGPGELNSRSAPQQ